MNLDRALSGGRIRLARIEVLAGQATALARDPRICG
jgi:hypothetical protein